MRTSTTLRVSILVLVGLGAYLTFGAAVGDEPPSAFAAPFRAEEESRVRPDEPARTLGSFELPASNGRITFLDETPSARTPTLSVVVVEEAGHGTAADAMAGGATALELFLEFAPPGTKVPDRIQLAYDLDDRSSRRSPPRSITTVHLQGDAPVPAVEPDDWGYYCANQPDWEAGFSSWVSSMQFPLQATFVTDEMEIPHATQVYGYFGYNDTIWAGVCMRSGEVMHVGMQYRNHNGYWVSVGGAGSMLTKADLEPGQRYLYHSYKPFTAQRRIYVSATGEVGPGNWAILSGAWDEKFLPDSNYAHP